MKLFTKHIFLLIPLLVSPFFLAQAQMVDYNRIIPPANMANADFAEKLVRLSWQNLPQNTAVQLGVNIAEQELTITRWSWLDRVAISGNLNEFTIAGNGPTGANGEPRALFYPRYNISLSISPGMFVSVPARTKIAKENLRIAELEVNDQKIIVRNRVLQQYQDYLMMKQIFEMETKTLESATTEFELLEERFKRGQVILADYSQAASQYTGQQRQRLQAETAYIKSKLELEALIGVRLEDVK